MPIKPLGYFPVPVQVVFAYLFTRPINMNEWMKRNRRNLYIHCLLTPLNSYIYKITQNVALRCTDVGNYSKGGESISA